MLHGQFELIHPFVDGNGRIGRILIPLFLFERKLLSRPVFYLSAYIEEHKDEYVAGLSALSSKEDPDAWNRWVKFFLQAVTEQAKKNLDAARRIIDLYERSKAEIIQITHSQYAVPLLDVLFEQPVFSPAQLVRRAGMPSKQMIMSLLGRLTDAGILAVTRASSGRRPQILAFAELVNLCEGHELVRVPKTRRAIKVTARQAVRSRAR
jgi:Fic family protein